MLRFRLNELIADKEFKERRRATVQEVAEAAGISRTTLSKVLNQHGVSMRTENLDRLCNYFGCTIEELVLHVPDSK